MTPDLRAALAGCSGCDYDEAEGGLFNHCDKCCRKITTLAYAHFAALAATAAQAPDDKTMVLFAMVEGLHAMIYGVYSTNSGDYARTALGDGGSIHEYVHKMLLLLPPRSPEQVQSGGIPTAQAQGAEPLCPYCNPCIHRSIITCRSPASAPWADDGVKWPWAGAGPPAAPEVAPEPPATPAPAALQDRLRKRTVAVTAGPLMSRQVPDRDCHEAADALDERDEAIAELKRANEQLGEHGKSMYAELSAARESLGRMTQERDRFMLALSRTESALAIERDKTEYWRRP